MQEILNKPIFQMTQTN